MLKPSFLAKVADKVVELFEMLNIFAVRDMARRIADAGNHMTASADYQAYLLVQSGELLEDIEDEIADVLGESDEVVRQIFEESTLVSQTNDRTAAGEAATAEAAPAGTAAEPSAAGAAAEPAAPQEAALQEATPAQAAEDARAAQEAVHAAEQAQATEAERQEQAAEAAQAAQEQTAQEAAQTEVPQLSEQALKDVQVLYEQTNGELENFTQTTAEEAQKDFIEACSDAMAKVRSGLESPEQAIREAIEKAARQGLHVTYPSGHVDAVEVAVRRAVMTGVNQASLRMTIDECDRMGTNFVIVSSHLGARVSDIDPHANHAGWQGGVYRIANPLMTFTGRSSTLTRSTAAASMSTLRTRPDIPPTLWASAGTTAGTACIHTCRASRKTTCRSLMRRRTAGPMRHRRSREPWSGRCAPSGGRSRP